MAYSCLVGFRMNILCLPISILLDKDETPAFPGRLDLCLLDNIVRSCNDLCLRSFGSVAHVPMKFDMKW